MENKIVLSSTQRGYMSDYFWALFWCIALFYFASWCSNLIESVYASLNVNSWSELQDIRYRDDRYEKIPWFMSALPLPHIGMYISRAIMVLFAIGELHTMVYGAREVNTFFQNEDGFWNKLTCDVYGFPFSRDVKQVVFDRIIHINVVQSSISRILNTGHLKIKMITFTNADSKEQDWTIPAIIKPYERKAELEKALMDHEGLRVKLDAEKNN